MTQLQRPQVKTGVRWGYVYGWDVIDHDSWMAGTPRVVLNDYVGQSRQKGRARENQHRDDKPWADLAVGSPRVLWEGWCTDEQLDEMERRFIQDVPLEQRPRLNWKLNEDNRRQIPIPRQKEQRHARDARRGEQAWEPTAYRPEVYGYPPAPAARRRTVRRWRPWQKHTLGVGIAWTALTTAAWIILAVNGRWVPQAWWATPAGVLAVVVWCWLGCPTTEKQWKRRWRKARRRLR